MRIALITFFTTLLLMLWPLAVNRAPFYSADSASYLHGGEFGFNTGLLILDHWWQSLVGATASVGGDPKVIVAQAVAESGGTRSVIYSVATYLLRAPGISLIALAIAQAASVALIVTLLIRLIAPRSDARSGITTGASVALLTSASWYAASVVPDIFAGVAIAGIVALTILFERTSLVVRLTLVLVIAFCISAHSSHFPIAAGTVVAGAVVHFWLHRLSLGEALRRVLWFASPVVLAVAAVVGTSYAAFGEPSLAPKRYPIQLARSVEDGPGRMVPARPLRDRTLRNLRSVRPEPAARRRRVPVVAERRPLSRDARADGADPRGGEHHRPPRRHGLSRLSAPPVRFQHGAPVLRFRNRRSDLRHRPREPGRSRDRGEQARPTRR